jgi:hypothetical protein
MRYIETDFGFTMHLDTCLAHFGYMPSRNETITFEGHQYKVVTTWGDYLDFEAI